VVDLTTHRRSVWAAPAELHGANAVTSAGDVLFFHSPYKDPDGIYRWRPGGTASMRIGAYSGVTRGLPLGRLLAIHDNGFTVISLVDEL
jgi:hypothetical protein